MQRHPQAIDRVENDHAIVDEVIDFQLMLLQYAKMTVDYFHLAQEELVVQQLHRPNVIMRHDLESLFH